MSEAENLLDLYLFTVVVEAGGFSAGARQSGTTKSRLSRRIIELEKRLGARLLYRDARRFSMTPVGEQVYRHAMAVRDAAQAAAFIAKGAPGAHVRLHAEDALLPLIGGMLDAFGTRHPHTHLSILQGGDSGHRLLSHQADVVLHTGTELPDNADIVAHPLAALRQVMVASPRLLAHGHSPHDPAAIPEHQCIAPIGDEPRRGLTLPLRHPSPRFASNHAGLLLAAARAGMGYVRLPLYLCHDDIRLGHLQIAYPTHLVPSLHLHALTRRSDATGHAAHDMVQFVREYLTDAPIAGLEANSGNV